jgi:hypothetical protein
VLEDLGVDDAVVGAVVQRVGHLLEVPLDVADPVVREQRGHPALGAVGPLVGRDADVDRRRVVAAVGQRRDLVPRRRPELDEPGRRVEPLFEQGPGGRHTSPELRRRDPCRLRRRRPAR